MGQQVGLVGKWALFVVPMSISGKRRLRTPSHMGQYHLPGGMTETFYRGTDALPLEPSLNKEIESILLVGLSSASLWGIALLILTIQVSPRLNQNLDGLQPGPLLQPYGRGYCPA